MANDHAALKAELVEAIQVPRGMLSGLMAAHAVAMLWPLILSALARVEREIVRASLTYTCDRCGGTVIFSADTPDAPPCDSSGAVPTNPYPTSGGNVYRASVPPAPDSGQRFTAADVVVQAQFLAEDDAAQWQRVASMLRELARRLREEEPRG